MKVQYVGCTQSHNLKSGKMSVMLDLVVVVVLDQTKGLGSQLETGLGGVLASSGGVQVSECLVYE